MISSKGRGAAQEAAPDFSDKQVEAALWAFFGAVWGSDKRDGFSQHRSRLRREMRAALVAAAKAGRP